MKERTAKANPDHCSFVRQDCASTDSASSPPYGLCSSVFRMVDFAMRQWMAWTTPSIHPKSSKARTTLMVPRMYDRDLPLAKRARKYRSSNLDLSTPCCVAASIPNARM